MAYISPEDELEYSTLHNSLSNHAFGLLLRGDHSPAAGQHLGGAVISEPQAPMLDGTFRKEEQAGVLPYTSPGKEDLAALPDLSLPSWDRGAWAFIPRSPSSEEQGSSQSLEESQAGRGAALAFRASHQQLCLRLNRTVYK